MPLESESDDRIAKRRQVAETDTVPPERTSSDAPAEAIANLQRQIGNRAVQRLLVQRSGDGPFALDEETQARIDRERSSGQPLDGSTQVSMEESTGFDLSRVRVHTSSEADDLNRELSAEAFTTGQDIFFSSGTFQPNSSQGQELLAHEMTHVVQQSTGAVGSGSGPMTVNAPGDVYEQEADATAQAIASGKSLDSANGGAEVQRQVEEEELPMATAAGAGPELEEEEML